jgi:D-serine deaminase-like pyridoxal phosphate-dependent protein
LIEGWSLVSLSQEHGVLAADSDVTRLRPGDLVLVAPVHACLTCEQYSAYHTLGGVELPRYRRD